MRVEGSAGASLQLLRREFEENSQVGAIKTLRASGADEEDKGADVLVKCLTISRRIMAGDKVPQADHRYLRKHNPELYLKALLLRRPKENPIKHKQLSKKESAPEAESTLETEAAGPSGVEAAGDIGALLDIDL